MRISYSALNTYKTCPLRFKLQELDKIRAPKNIEAIFGALIHGCLKHMFERTPLYPTLDEILDYFNNLWQQKKFAEFNKEEERSYYEDGVSILKNFYRLNPPWNFNIVDLESRFEALIPDRQNNENHVLVGIIDRIDKSPTDNTFEIIDYKTSRRMPSQEMLDNDLQMSIYHLGLIKRWPHLQPQKIKLSLYFLKHGEKITTNRSQDDLEKTKNLILQTINEIQGKIKDNYDFPPYPTALCDWCGHKPQCPMWKHQFQSQNSNLKTQNQIEEIIKEYFSLKDQNQANNKRLGALQKSIYEFMEQEKLERVFGAEGYLTKILQERNSYDMKKIKQILLEISKWDEVRIKKRFVALKASKNKISK